MNLNVKVMDFEGPLDLLLSLIEKEEIDIYNIPIHLITTKYIEMIDESDIDIDALADFLVLASILLEIKSKMLLPDVELEPIGLDSDEDPRYELMMKLLEYKKIKEISKYLEKSHEKELIIYSEEANIYHDLSKDVKIVEEDLDIAILEEAFKRVLNRLERFNNDKKDFFENINRENFTVESKRKHIFERLTSFGKLSFDSLFTHNPVLEEVITTFLALLEIIRDSHVKVEQNAQFGEIILVKR